jgi:hypothetical protein
LVPAIVLAALVLAACGNDDPKASGSHDAQGSSQNTQASVRDEMLVSIPHVGKVTWSCGGKHPGSYSMTLIADPLSATDKVTWTAGDGAPVKKALQPGRKLTLGYGGTGQYLQIVQATEPRTTTATVTVHFKGCSKSAMPTVNKKIKTKKNF